ncbi:MAG: hypothetical protein PVH41_09430 [Anaerolineae bacterium]|jgi:hypothetical protein
MESFEDILPTEEEEEQAPERARSNRTFVILVAVLGGLLVLAIGAFVAWAAFIAPNLRADIESQNEATFATNTAVAVALAGTETAAAYTPTPTDTPVPTNTPFPTSTASPRPSTDTPEPQPAATVLAETPTSEVAEVGATEESGAMPETGVGVLAGVLLGGGLAVLLVLVRRIRRAA